MRHKTFVSDDPRKVASLIRHLPLHAHYAWVESWYVRLGAADTREERTYDRMANKSGCKVPKNGAGQWEATDILRMESKEMEELRAAYEKAEVERKRAKLASEKKRRK